MRVFISWSGDRSRALAEALAPWLRRVLQRAQTWLSAEYIAKGQRWGFELANRLDDTDVGIICVTRENMMAPWIHFEAGALSKKVGHSRVIPYLLGVDFRELPGPFQQFQAAKAEKTDTLGMMHSLNAQLGNEAIQSKDFDDILSKWWSDLEAAINEIPESPAAPPPEPSKEDKLAERIEATLFEIVRRLPPERKPPAVYKNPVSRDTIDKAIVMVAAYAQVAPEAAYKLLVEAAHRRKTTAADLAALIVEEGADDFIIPF